jgi:hemoglobin
LTKGLQTAGQITWKKCIPFGKPHCWVNTPIPDVRFRRMQRFLSTRWVSLFTETIDELFTGEKAEEAKWRAGKIAEMFEMKVWHFQNNPNNIV